MNKILKRTWHIHRRSNRHC